MVCAHAGACCCSCKIEHQLSALPHIEAKLQLLTMNQESVLGYMKALIDIANEEGEE